MFFKMLLALLLSFTLNVRAQTICKIRTPDWTTPTLELRTDASAIVVSGVVLQVLPDQRQSDGSYPADVVISNVYKGYDSLNNVSAVSLSSPHDNLRNVYRITGFGSPRNCLSPVAPHSKYILFLNIASSLLDEEEASNTIIQREYVEADVRHRKQLKLEYGSGVEEPVEELNNMNEKRVLTRLGWKPWGAWSRCGVNCGTSNQHRRRTCVKDVPDACEGEAKQRRICNAFKCEDMRDVLHLMNLSDLTRGVRRPTHRHSAFRISSEAQLQLPISFIYNDVFPQEFSILISFKTRQSSVVEGVNYAMMITDPSGNLRIGISVDEYPIVVYTHNNQIKSIEFPQWPLNPGWHFISFAIGRNAVTMIADCSEIYRELLPTGHQIVVDVNCVLSIGEPSIGVNHMSDIIYSGEMEQLVILDGVQGATQQCLRSESMLSSPPQNLLDAFPVPPSTTSTEPPTSPAITTEAIVIVKKSDGGNTFDSPISIPAEINPNIINPILIPSDLKATTKSLPPFPPPTTPTPPPPPTTTAAVINLVSTTSSTTQPSETMTPVPTTTSTPQYTTVTTAKAITPVPLSTTEAEIVDNNLIPLVQLNPSSLTAGPHDKGDGNDNILEIIAEDNFANAAKMIIVITDEPEETRPTREADLQVVRPTEVPGSTLTKFEEVTEQDHKTQNKALAGRASAYISFDEDGGGVEWSAWSSCSTTCGTGSRYRFGFCKPGSQVLDCQRGKVVAAQTRSCTLSNCGGTLQWSDWSSCSKTCGSDARRTRLAFCPDQFAHPDCQRPGQSVVEREDCGLPACGDACTPACTNGGHCQPGRPCVCPPGYAGHYCQHQTCQPNCLNGGQCLGNNFCLCPPGTSPPDCSITCSSECANGGTCTSGNQCICQPGYGGLTCNTAICDQPCQNGGSCIAPNSCNCPQGFRGTDCNEPICAGGCANGGHCTRRGICRCKAGYRGSRCDVPFCRYSCRNGGRCTGPDECMCPKSYTGRLCHKSKCPRGCSPGSTCIGKNLCVASSSSSSSSRTKAKRKQSSSRKSSWCRLQSFQEAYQISYIKPVIKNIQLQCGPRGTRTCNSQRLEYTIAYRTKLRTSYRCAPHG